MRRGKALPAELTLWQCETCQRVMDFPGVAPGAQHLKSVEDHDPQAPWCTGRLVEHTYRLVTRSDFTLRA